MKFSNNIKKILRIVVKWLPFAVITTFLIGFSYLANQQNLRVSASDPQIQLAEDYAVYLKDGNYPDDLSQFQKVNIDQSLSTFVIIMDDSGKVIGSSASLDSKSPTPPQSSIDDAKKNGQNRFTWEPKEGIRSAVVLVRIEGTKPGYVLVGRSLREIEKRERALLIQAAIIYPATLLVTFLTVALTSLLSNRKSRNVLSEVIETNKVNEEVNLEKTNDAATWTDANEGVSNVIKPTSILTPSKKAEKEANKKKNASKKKPAK